MPCPELLGAGLGSAFATRGVARDTSGSGRTGSSLPAHDDPLRISGLCRHPGSRIPRRTATISGTASASARCGGRRGSASSRCRGSRPDLGAPVPEAALDLTNHLLHGPASRAHLRFLERRPSWSPSPLRPTGPPDHGNLGPVRPGARCLRGRRQNSGPGAGTRWAGFLNRWKSIS
jgi:hypothetical protein